MNTPRPGRTKSTIALVVFLVALVALLAIFGVLVAFRDNPTAENNLIRVLSIGLIRTPEDITAVTECMHWVVLNRAPLANILGVICDLIGAVLVAYEVVRKFRGRQFGDSFTFDPDVQQAPQPTEVYRHWEERKFRFMKWGLALLIAGFLLQFAANVFQLKHA